MPETRWYFPTVLRPPEAGELHLWRCTLRASAAELCELQQVLSPDELERARRFRFSGDRDRFIAGRGRLRLLLSRYLGRAPGEIRFCFAPSGKPALANAPGDARVGDARLRFNLSHSGDLALYGLTTDRELGVDIEQIRPANADGAVAESLFSPRELELLRRLPELERQAAFFVCWTLREAYAKGIGAGLTAAYPRFDGSAALRGAGPLELPPWWLYRVNVAAGYAAAVAVAGEVQHMQHWQWSESAPGPGRCEERIPIETE